MNEVIIFPFYRNVKPLIYLQQKYGKARCLFTHLLYPDDHKTIWLEHEIVNDINEKKD